MKTTIRNLANQLQHVEASSEYKTYSIKNFEVFAIMNNGDVKYAFKFSNRDENGNVCSSIDAVIDISEAKCSESELKGIIIYWMREAAELEEINKINKSKNYQPDGDEENLDFFGVKYTQTKDITDISRENDGF